MSIFTPLPNWTNAQDRTAANEIVRAYSERRQCVGDSAVALIAAGSNAQDTSFWRGMQEWFTESNVSKWVNHGSFSVDTEYEAADGYRYSLSSFRTAAGIPNGFRRATEWPTDWTDYNDPAYSYGTISRDDIRGPWIFQDLQKAFDALRWTYTYDIGIGLQAPGPITSSFSGAEARLGQSTLEDTNQEAYDAAVADYSLVTASGAPYIVTYDMRYSAGTDTYACDLYRESADVVYSDIPQHINHQADAFYWVQDSELFFDFDGLGILPKKIFITESFASASVSTRTQSKVIGTATPPSQYGTETLTINTSTGSWGMIVKWNFSHTL